MSWYSIRWQTVTVFFLFILFFFFFFFYFSLFCQAPLAFRVFQTKMLGGKVATAAVAASKNTWERIIFSCFVGAFANVCTERVQNLYRWGFYARSPPLRLVNVFLYIFQCWLDGVKFIFSYSVFLFHYNMCLYWEKKKKFPPLFYSTISPLFSPLIKSFRDYTHHEHSRQLGWRKNNTLSWRSENHHSLLKLQVDCVDNLFHFLFSPPRLSTLWKNCA